jgi:hypothetical protein
LWAEKRLAAAAAESCAHIRAFARLEQNDHDERYTNNYMKYDNKN